VNTCGNLVKRQRVCIVTGSYYRNYQRTTQADPAGYSYAESKQHPDKPLGGKFLILTPRKVAANNPGKSKSKLRWIVQQDVMTSLSRMPARVTV
jgi:hypothetical protein